jgi:hypothetical protein
MSDRPQGSVRTGTREEGTKAGTKATAGAEAVPAAGEARVEQPVSATQSIPTGQNRVVQSGRPASAATPPATGTSRAVAAGTATKTPDATTAASGTPEKKPAGKAPVTARGKSATTAGRKPAAKGGRGPRRARLQLRHIDTWSAFKISFVLSIALFFIWMVAVGVLYGVLSALGVFDTLNDLFGQLGSASGSTGGGDVVTPGVVFGGAAVIGAINIVLLTALCTVGTFIYNLCSDLVGGLELTLSERD